MQIETVIKGYRVTLDTDMNGDGEVSGCWIEQGGYSASLACLEDTGRLHNSRWSDEVEVPQSVIDEIGAWAVNNGY